MRNFKSLIFVALISIVVVYPVNSALAEDIRISYNCSQYFENGAFNWSETDEATDVMELVAKGIGLLRGRTRNHLPVYGDIKIETVNDSERVATLMQDYPAIVASESNEIFNLVTEIVKRLNLEIIPDENYKSAQKLLQALAITAEPKEDENYPFTKHFLDFYAIDLGSGKHKYTLCPINGELQFEAFDNFGR